jgi:26S proteasome regulatory subunit N8
MSSESKTQEAPPPAEGGDALPPALVTARPVESVVVHPLVLLSVTDHYNRVAKDTRKRVVGVLLGETYKGRG